MENIENKIPNGENQNTQNSSFFSENVSSSNGLEAKFPLLRFRKFSHPWKQEKLSNFTSRIMRKNSNNETELPLTISSKDGLVDQVTFFNKKVSSKDMSGYYLLKNGEFAYNKSYSNGYDFGSIKRLERYEMGALSTLYICFSLKKHCSDYIKHYFDSLKWYRQIYVISAEGARNHGLLNVPTDDFFATTHYLSPYMEEQQKIANFLSLVDQRIEKQRQLVESLKKYKRGLVFHLFNKNNPINKSIPMRDLLTEINDRNSVGLRVCSVAVIKGIVDQIEHLGRSFSASDTSKYRRVHFGDVVYTKSPTGDFPFGIVKQSKIKEDVAVSPLYGVYKPSSYSTGNLLHLYFEQYQYANNYIRSLAQKGAKNTINITTQHFLEKNIIFPYNEVDRVYFSNFFEKLNKLIKFNEGELEKAQSLKKGLLQQMFI